MIPLMLLVRPAEPSGLPKTCLLIPRRGYPMGFFMVLDNNSSIKIDKTQVELAVCDTAGHSVYETLRYFSNSGTDAGKCDIDVILMCFSGDSNSSESLKSGLPKCPCNPRHQEEWHPHWSGRNKGAQAGACEPKIKDGVKEVFETFFEEINSSDWCLLL